MVVLSLHKHSLRITVGRTSVRSGFISDYERYITEIYSRTYTVIVLNFGDVPGPASMLVMHVGIPQLENQGRPIRDRVSIW